MSREQLDPTAYPELLKGLSPETAQSAPELLCATAEELITAAGERTTINAQPGIVVPWCYEKVLGDTLYYVKLGKLVQPPKGYEQPMILFDDTPDLTVTTPNLAVLRFMELGAGKSLVVDNEVASMPDPLLDDERYLGLATEIIGGINAAYAQAMRLKEERRGERLQHLRHPLAAIHDFFTDPEYADEESAQTRGGRRQSYLKAGSFFVGLTVAAYGHRPFTGADAKTGPIPMPQPIELLVDWNNGPDHAAQGYEEPEGATEVTVGDIAVRLPILEGYDTNDVPRSKYVDPWGRAVEESRPGLYRVDVSSLADESTGDEYAASGDETAERDCLLVHGDFRSGVSSVFTQDLATQENIRLDVRSGDELEACMVEGAGEEFEGEFFIWQDK